MQLWWHSTGASAYETHLPIFIENHYFSPGRGRQAEPLCVLIAFIRTYLKQSEHVLYSFSSLLLQQPFEKVEAVTVTLQFPNLTSRAILPSQLFSKQHAPISRDALDLSSRSAMCFKGYNLVCVKPVVVVGLFEFAIESCSTEILVDDLELRQDSGEKFLQGERCETSWQKSVEGCSWGCVGGIEAYSNDEIVVSNRVR